MTNRRLSDREAHLLNFLVEKGDGLTDLSLAHALLAPLTTKRGQAVRGFATNPRNSYVRHMLYKLRREGFLWKHEYADAYLMSRKLELLIDAPRLRSLTRRNPNRGHVEHDLLTLHLLVALERALRRRSTWDYKVHLDGAEPVIRGKRKVKLDKLVEIWSTSRTKRFYYFVETDRATASLQTHLPGQRSIQRKAELFYQALKDKEIKEQFGVPGARLLFLVSKERKGRLRSIERIIRGSKKIPDDAVSEVFRFHALSPSDLEDDTLVHKLTDALQ